MCNPAKQTRCEWCEKEFGWETSVELDGTGVCSEDCMRSRALFWDPDLAAYEMDD